LGEDRHIHRFFVSGTPVSGQIIPLDPEDAFHAARVLRLKVGARIEVAGGGRAFEATVEHVDKGSGGRTPYVKILPGNEILPATHESAQPCLTVIQGLPQGRKLDLIVEKLSEIGAERLIPAVTEKSIVKESGSWEKKLKRWRRVAAAAASQARRVAPMEVGGPLELIDAIEGAEHPLVLSTEVQGVPLGKAIGDLMDSSSDRDGQTVTLVIGPEAGFSSKEIETLRSRGAEFVSLGRLVLRTETAALVAAAIVMHRLGEIG
jgi:16S rRNA (uracil1498-N3)-methyltransferase